MARAVVWNSPAFIGGRRLSLAGQYPSGACMALNNRTTASVYAFFGALFMPKSKISHALLATLAKSRSITRSGDGMLDAGNCGISRGTCSPRPRANAAAADGRSGGGHELHPPMRMKL